MPTVHFGKRPGRTRGRPEDRATATGKVLFAKLASAPDMFTVVQEGDTNNYVIDYNSDVSGTIDETTSSTQLEAALESSAAVVDCTVTGSGTRKDPFIFTMVDSATDNGPIVAIKTNWKHTVVKADRQDGPGDRE